MVADPPANELDAATAPTPPAISSTAPNRTAVRPNEILCIVPRLFPRRHALRVAGQRAMRADHGKGESAPRGGERNVSHIGETTSAKPTLVLAIEQCQR